MATHQPLELLLATGSSGKIREIREMTDGLDWNWRSLAEFPAVPEAIEDGTTFIENATRKALHYSQRTGLPALADDSGLEVDALGGRPGVDSAYFAGLPRDDAANNRLLLEKLRGISPPLRTARFRCCMVLAIGGDVVAQTEGAIEGRIIEEARGPGGFGYDPLFLIEELGKTTAELPPAQKNAISHRGRALSKMIPLIRAWAAGR